MCLLAGADSEGVGAMGGGCRLTGILLDVLFDLSFSECRVLA